MGKMETTGAFIGRKLSDIGSALYRNIAFPFVKCAIERRCDSIIGKGAYLYNGCTLAGRDYIGDKTELCNARIGYSVYIGPKSTVSNAIIGNYSCIAGLEPVAGRHPVKGECISVHPAFYSGQGQYGYTYVKGASRNSAASGASSSGESSSGGSGASGGSSSPVTFEEVRYVDSEHKYTVCIGNDVWIGRGVMIVDGVTVGDGAVIGAGSLVTGDIEPYAIYAGTPAKRIGSRFDDKSVSALLDLRWWDKSEEWIRKHSELFCDPERFFKEVL